jgi:hypothetical protein
LAILRLGHPNALDCRFEVLNLISFFAVVINAMVIAFTSSFVPRQVYLYDPGKYVLAYSLSFHAHQQCGSVSSYIERVYPISPVTDVNGTDYQCHYFGFTEDDGTEGVFYYQARDQPNLILTCFLSHRHVLRVGFGGSPCLCGGL